MSMVESATRDAGSTKVVEKVDLKLEVVVIPVADADRAKAFYERLGWRLDADFAFDNDFRVIQFTPPGSAASIQFGTKITTAAPGHTQGLYLIVSDIEAARGELAGLGVEISEPFHPAAPGAQFPADATDRLSGPASDHATYGSLATFNDPDGNEWLLQEVTQRLPGRIDATETTYASRPDLADAMRRASVAHGEHEKRMGGEYDTNWLTGTPPTWWPNRQGLSCRHERTRRPRGVVMSTSLSASIQPQFQLIDGLNIRYADTGGPHDTTLLPTSPWPESLYAYTPMWTILADHARLFAVDLPGFGASERRDDLLSPRAMGGFLATLVAEAGLGRPHIVAPDVGTSAALFGAATHPELFASVDPDLDKYRRIDPHIIVNTSLDKVAGGVADNVRADYLACYEGDRFVESMRYVRRYPEELPALAELLPQITTPVTIINGRYDRVVPLANAEFLHERLPNSRLRIIDAGHFVWEERPAEYAATILESISGSDS